MSENRRILIVDDNQIIHEDIKSCLIEDKSNNSQLLNELESKILGESSAESKVDIEFTIDSALQGKEALTMIENALKNGTPYAMCFMDVRMPPGMDGIETIEKAWKIQPDLEVVICTAFSDYSWDQVIERLGFSDKLLFLKKPFESVAIKQFALTLTQKWNVRQKTNQLLQNMHRIIKKKSKEPQLTAKDSVHAAQLQAVGEMAGGIAHEINNPLTVIMTSSELLKAMVEKYENNEKLVRYADKIQLMTDRIVEIISSLRSMAGRNDQAEMQAHHIERVFKDLLNLSENKVRNQDIKIEVEGRDNPSLNTICHLSQIQQVLFSMILNSVDAFKEIENFEGNKRIDIKCFAENNQLIIDYRDNGCGIPSEVIPKIFLPFFSTKETGKGVGMGLSVVKGIIESHNGDIQYLDDTEGAHFVISLPLADEAEVAA